jgi:hypothetical protein
MQGISNGAVEGKQMREPKKKWKKAKFVGIIPLPEQIATRNEMRAIEAGERLERIAKSLEDLVAVFGGSIRLPAG